MRREAPIHPSPVIIIVKLSLVMLKFTVLAIQARVYMSPYQNASIFVFIFILFLWFLSFSLLPGLEEILQVGSKLPLVRRRRKRS
jgi:hypothetical protein